MSKQLSKEEQIDLAWSAHQAPSASKEAAWQRAERDENERIKQERDAAWKRLDSQKSK